MNHIQAKVFVNVFFQVKYNKISVANQFTKAQYVDAKLI